MSSDRTQSGASHHPTPGSYPEGSVVNSPPSVVSTSVDVRDKVSNLLKDVPLTACTFKGEPNWVIPKDQWRIFEEKLRSLQHETGTTVPVAELAELQRELSALRLKAHDFENANERLAYAEKSLTEQLNVANSKFADAKNDAASARMALEATQIELKSSLSRARTIKSEYETALLVAKKEGDAGAVEKLSSDKRKLSTDITDLNNSLQHVNAEKKRITDQLKRYENQVLELSNELKLEKSKHAISSGDPGTSFAEKARQAGTESVKLFNVAHSNLSALARERFSKVADDPLADEKNTAFWLKATFDACKHSVYRPYRLVFGGLAGDLKAFSAKSRKLFDPFLIAVRDSLLPTGRPLSAEDLNEMLSSIHNDSIELAPEFRARGYRTLADLPSNLGPVGDIDPTSLPYKGKHKISLVDNSKPRDRANSVFSSSDEEKDVLASDPLISPSSESSDDEVSYWLRMRRWFLVKFDSINSRVRASLRKHPLRLKRYFKLATGNKFQKVCLVPYSWYIWLFP
jgi:regulator of replication initiation timing